MNPAGTPPPALPIRFGIFEVDVASGELRKRGVKIKLQEQPFQALVALLRRPGEIVTREELRLRLWPPDVVVDFDSGLNKAINRLREALGDDADNPRFIETLPQRGYRFLAQVEGPPAQPPTTPVAAIHDDSAPVGRRAWIALAAGSLSIPLLYLGYRTAYPPSKRIESIAVLPLENLSGDPEQEYFSDGMTDALIGEIARIAPLRVISRTSIMRYKRHSRMLLPEIARELKVDAIVEGTVVKSGSNVRITAQLIRAQDDRHLWAERYERELTDVLTVQSDVARAIAAQIRTNLTPHNSPERSRPLNAAAYDAFLKANYFLAHGMRNLANSIDLFKRSIDLDPSRADAHSGLAEAYCYAAIFGFMPSADGYAAARVAALQALQLDESNAGAHNALADVKKGYDWDLAGAEIEYKRALQLNPSHLLTRLWYAECLSRMRRHDQAIEESGRAVALDPVSSGSYANRAMLLFRARRYNESIQAGQQALELEPAFVNALWWQGLSHAGNRDFPSSIACLNRAIAMSPRPLFRSLLGYVYGRAGDKTKALAAVAELMKSAGYVSPVDFAVIYAGLGDANATFDWLEKAYRSRAARVHELVAPYFDNFRSDPRYNDLLKRVGLPL